MAGQERKLDAEEIVVAAALVAETAAIANSLVVVAAAVALQDSATRQIAPPGAKVQARAEPAANRAQTAQQGDE